MYITRGDTPKTRPAGAGALTRSLRKFVSLSRSRRDSGQTGPARGVLSMALDLACRACLLVPVVRLRDVPTADAPICLLDHERCHFAEATIIRTPPSINEFKLCLPQCRTHLV